MTRTLLTSLSLLALTLSAVAQKGDRKEHNNMNDIVPSDIIPPAPVLSVEEALKAFSIQEGFEIESVAAEPHVDKPVALAFDKRGRMWVCEMRGYMPSIDGEEEGIPMGRITILEDTDGDGKVDDRKVFLEKLHLPRTIALVDGGVLVGDQTQLYFIERDGDQAKGELQVIDAEYAKGSNVEHKPNGMITALDNWMYNAKSNFRYQWRDGKLTKDKTLFRGQWGITQDDWGRLFYNSNSTMLLGDRFQPNLLTGNSKVKLKASLSTWVGNNLVYPGRITPGLNRAYISKKNGYKNNILDPKTYKLIKCTAACGPVIYRGDQFPSQFKGTAFIAESGAQLVKAISISRKKGRLSGSHTYKNSEFLTSTDERFRPVNIYNAPDGSLYLLDFYHGIIQHKTYMTSYLRRQTLSRGLEGPGLGHGRIYRIKAANRPLSPVLNLENATTQQLVDTLKSESGSNRDLAQKTIVDRQITDSAASLRELLASNAPAVSKAHALWTLEGLSLLNPSDLASTLGSDDEDLVVTSLYATLSLSDKERTQLLPEIEKVADNPATAPVKARVLAQTPSEDAHQKLVKLLKKFKKKPKNQKEPTAAMAAIAGLGKTSLLFQEVNKGSYKEKEFNKLLVASTKDVEKKVDPEKILKGDHLASYKRGKEMYSGRAACIGCHGADGAGLPNLGPTLDKSDWVTGDHNDLAKVLLYGLQGPIKINGEMFTPQAFMPGLAQNSTITDQDLADIMTFLRHGWNNRAGQVTKGEVAKIRKETKHLTGTMMKAEDFPAKQ